MKIKDIKPNPRNPRTITEPALVNLAKSIKLDPEFMRLRPIVVDGNGMILGGNQRYRAIKEKLGMTDIPDDWITRADNLTEDQRKRFVVVDNSPDGMSGSWDSEIMAEDWDVPTMEDWGFEAGQAGCEIENINFEKKINYEDDISQIVLYCTAMQVDAVLEDVKKIKENYPGLIVRVKDA